jgi:hypothetical protein
VEDITMGRVPGEEEQLAGRSRKNNKYVKNPDNWPLCPVVPAGGCSGIIRLLLSLLGDAIGNMQMSESFTHPANANSRPPGPAVLSGMIRNPRRHWGVARDALRGGATSPEGDKSPKGDKQRNIT